MTGNLKKGGIGGIRNLGILQSMGLKPEPATMEKSEQKKNVNELILGLQHHKSYTPTRKRRHNITQYTPKEFYPQYYVDFENNKGKKYVYSGINKNETTGKYYLNFNEVYRKGKIPYYTQNIGTANISEADSGNPENRDPVHIDLNTDNMDEAKNMDITSKEIFVINDTMKKYKETWNYFQEHFDPETKTFPAGIAPLSSAIPHQYYKGFDKAIGGKKRRTKKRKSMKKKQRKTKKRKSLKKRKSIKKRKA